jgi:hypothetical protein
VTLLRKLHSFLKWWSENGHTSLAITDLKRDWRELEKRLIYIREISMSWMNRKIDPAEIEKRIRAWAEVTTLCLELKYAAMRKRRPELSEDEISELVRKQLTMLKIVQNEC